MRIRDFPPTEIRARPSTNAARSRRTPTGWAQISPANRSVRAASRARSLRGAPIRPAHGSRARAAFWFAAVSSWGKRIYHRDHRGHRDRREKSPDRLSKGILFFVQPAVQDGLIGVDAAIAEKWPVAARFLALCGVAFDDEDFFTVVG